MNIAETGSRPALLPLEEGGATFQIWTQKTATGSTPTLLNSTFVGAYKLSTTLAITSKDPYTAIPRTRSGKISEIAVRDTIHGRPVKNADALANPESLELYRNLPQLRD